MKEPSRHKSASNRDKLCRTPDVERQNKIRTKSARKTQRLTTYFLLLISSRKKPRQSQSQKAFSFVLTSTEEKYKKRPMTEARLKNQLRNRGSQRRPLWFAPPCAGRFARRDGPSRAGSRCQTRNRTPKRRHALDTSSADARAPANPRRARRVHAKSRRRKRSYRDKNLKIKYKCPK